MTELRFDEIRRNIQRLKAYGKADNALLSVEDQYIIELEAERDRIKEENEILYQRIGEEIKKTKMLEARIQELDKKWWRF